jgi:hypothetical protein
VKEMIERSKILREAPLYSIHLSLIQKWKNDQLEHYNSITERVQENEKPAKTGLFNKDLHLLVSKLEILKSFSVSTPDTVLVEQVAEAMKGEKENIKINIENS